MNNAGLVNNTLSGVIINGTFAMGLTSAGVLTGIDSSLEPERREPGRSSQWNNAPGGVLANSGYLVNTGNLNNLLGGVTTNLTGGSFENTFGTLNNSGVVNNTGGAFDNAAGTLNNTGTFNNTAGGILTNSVIQLVYGTTTPT